MKNIMKKVAFVGFALIMLSSCGGENSSEDESHEEVTVTENSVESESKSSDSSSKSSYSSSKSSYSESSDSLKDGEYYCMGKNDTCTNKTYSPTDLYCHSCDPDDNNIEGDQRTSGKSYGDGGAVIDNDYDGDIDDDDWEKAWGDYLDDKYDEYGY